MLSVDEAVALVYSGQEFALWSFPESREIHTGDALIGEFGKGSPVYRPGLSRPEAYTFQPPVSDMTRATYITRVDELIRRLRQTGGKTVIARTISRQATPEDAAGFCRRLFSGNTGFRFMFYTRATGLWGGCSPELLLRIDPSGQLTTMALAGTKKAADMTPWDEKNIAENAIVAAYIRDILSANGLSPEVSETETVVHGPVKHLRRMITARTSPDRFYDLVAALSPTPALAGYPLAEALHDIADIEQTPRGPYGGYIAVEAPDGSRRAYVILRTVNFSHGRATIFTGSGITPLSDAADEWEETAVKATTMLSLL